MKFPVLAAVLLLTNFVAAPSNAQEIEKQLDIPYAGTENPRQQLDVLLPNSPKSKTLPVIAFIHGGGWQNGDKSRAHGQLVRFVQSGDFAAVSMPRSRIRPYRTKRHRLMG